MAAHRAGGGLREALDGKLSAPMDVQVLTPHPAGFPAKGALSREHIEAVYRDHG